CDAPLLRSPSPYWFVLRIPCHTRNWIAQRERPWTGTAPCSARGNPSSTLLLGTWAKPLLPVLRPLTHDLRPRLPSSVLRLLVTPSLFFTRHSSFRLSAFT